MSFWVRCDRCPAVAPFDPPRQQSTLDAAMNGPAQPAFPSTWKMLRLDARVFHLCPACIASMEAWASNGEVTDA